MLRKIKSDQTILELWNPSMSEASRGDRASWAVPAAVILHRLETLFLLLGAPILNPPPDFEPPA